MHSDNKQSMFLTPDIGMTKKPDGCCYLYARQPLGNQPTSIIDYLDRWAKQQPDAVFLAERSKANPEDWQRISYAEIYQQSHRLAAALKGSGLSKERPLMLLSGNSIAFAKIMLACMLIGVPVVPVSPSYSLLSQDFAKVKYIHQLVNPGLVFAEHEQMFKGVLSEISGMGTAVVTAETESGGIADYSLAQWLSEQQVGMLPDERSPLQPDTIAKILFTSGSTGMPKGVINTHQMLTSNQEAIARIWPFIEQSGHIFLDWLPWHHTFGGNHNFNMALRNGATLYIDAGKPTPQGIRETLKNIASVSPTLYFNVAAGYELLVAHLEQDARLAQSFFKQLKLLFFAAAALPRSTWDRLQKLIDQYAPRDIPITSSWGATETSPLGTSVYFPNTIARNIGVPVPGTQVKLAPVGELTELRVKGPNIMPGYWRDDEKTAAVFDEEGYFCSGDAVELIDKNDPGAGMVFKGRVSENFKLLTGTWINVGELRVAVVEALSPLAVDVVICGHNKHYLSVLVFPNFAECEKFTDAADGGSLIFNEKLQSEFAHRLAAHNAKYSGSSKRIKKALLLESPPSIDDNEITDKGYLNQRGVLANRDEEVAALYSSRVDERVILAG